MRIPHAASAALAFAFSVLAVRAARADDGPKNPWVERPLALNALTAEIQAGLGVGQAPGSNAGTGANLEAALGLPLLGEIGVRTGYRFSAVGQATNADFYGRLFDHETPLLSSGAATFANPEVHWRRMFFPDAEIAAVAWEVRGVIPIADGTSFGLQPGIPVRFRVPHLVRIDTGLFVPITFSKDVAYSFSVPAALYVQVKDFFFGPMTGFRWDHLTVPATPLTPSASKDQADITAGIAAGYTLAGMLDLKAQVYTLRINDSNWSNLIGGGVGVGLLLP